MSRNWTSSLSGPITPDVMYNKVDSDSMRPVPRIRPEGAYIAEAHRGCLDILFKMQALTTGSGPLDKPRYRKVKPPSNQPNSEVMMENHQQKPTFIGVTRPCHPVVDMKRSSNPPPTSREIRDHQPPPQDDNQIAAINTDVRLIKAELESLKRRVHADSQLQGSSKPRPPTAYGQSRPRDVSRYQPDTSNRLAESPDTPYGQMKRPDTAYGQSRQQEKSRNRQESSSVQVRRPDTAYGQSRQQEVSRYRPDPRYDPYDDDEVSVEEQWDHAPRDWVERTRRRREVEEEVTYRRANGHTETYHRQTRNDRPDKLPDRGGRVRFTADDRGNNAESQRTFREPNRPALKSQNDDPDRPEGYHKVPDEDRRQMLTLLMKAEDEIRGRYTRLPVILDTHRSREYKKELEEALDELQSAIAVYAQKKVYIKNTEEKW